MAEPRFEDRDGEVEGSCANSGEASGGALAGASVGTAAPRRPLTEPPAGRLHDFGISLGAMALVACLVKGVLLVVKGYLSVWQALACMAWGVGMYAGATLLFGVIGWVLVPLREAIVRLYWWMALLLSYAVLWYVWDCLVPATAGP